jgi:hypothetical protein
MSGQWSRGFMGARLIDFSSGCEIVASPMIRSDQPLEWYKVVGIEVVIFVGILVPVLIGALTAR